MNPQQLLSCPVLRCRVRCEGGLHTIIRNRRGRLVLLDHSRQEVHRQHGFQQLGGQPCRCVRVFDLWKDVMRSDAAVGNLPKALKDTAYRCREIAAERTKQRTSQIDEYGQPCFERDAFMARLINRVLHRQCGVPDSVQLTIRPGRVQETRASGSWRTRRIPVILNVCYDGRIVNETCLARDWVKTIYLRGLSVVAGALTVFICPPAYPGEDGFSVRVGRFRVKDRKLSFKEVWVPMPASISIAPWTIQTP